MNGRKCPSHGQGSENFRHGHDRRIHLAFDNGADRTGAVAMPSVIGMKLEMQPFARAYQRHSHEQNRQQTGQDRSQPTMFPLR